MKILALFLWILVISTYHVNGDVIKNVDLIENETDWKTANEMCVLYGSSETEDFQKIILNTTMASSTVVWIAATPIYTPWVKLLGCFDIPEGTTKRNGDGTLNDCIKQCNHSNYIGLLGSNCYCLDIKPSTHYGNCIPYAVNLTPSAVQTIIFALEKGENDNESWPLSVHQYEKKVKYLVNVLNHTVRPYSCRIEWIYGLSQYRFFDERLTFEQAKGRCKEPNSGMHNGEDFPSMVSAWISSYWNMVTLKWGVDESLNGCKQCVGAMIENNRLKPRLLNCDRKLKSLCEPEMVKVITKPKSGGARLEESLNISFIWYLIIGGLGAGVAYLLGCTKPGKLGILVRKNKPTELQSEVSVNMNILRRQKPETTTQADQPDMDYSQIDDGNCKRKQ